MYELVHHPLRSEELFAAFLLVCVVGGVVVKVTKSVLAHQRRTQLDDMEATLKMEMIQRGMSAEEIVKVLQAKTAAPDADALRELAASIGREGSRWVRRHARQT